MQSSKVMQYLFDWELRSTIFQLILKAFSRINGCSVFFFSWNENGEGVEEGDTDLKQSDYKKKTQENTNNCEETKKSTRYFNGFDIRFFDLLFGDCNGKNSILHSSFDLIHFYILRKPKPPHELPAAPLHPVPRVVLIFLLNVPLSADVEDSIIFDLHFHLFLLQPGTSALNTCASGVSFQSTRALTIAEFS
ncbi:hypothetical protein G4B88_026235 [Cannabis sativa]|uniref:Uncharacterized protein n=1 Tax=Cannabis sativa TaxID=3483 RepID=A0A7J6DTM3_CANSA|nr:hypothetical protein G4B88_026235 [Cannabis sativa]